MLRCINGDDVGSSTFESFAVCRWISSRGELLLLSALNRGVVGVVANDVVAVDVMDPIIDEKNDLPLLLPLFLLSRLNDGDETESFIMYTMYIYRLLLSKKNREKRS